MITPEDKQLWQYVMKDVTPIHCTQTQLVFPQVISTKCFQQHNTVWDLHGMTLGQAHQLTLSEIHQQQHLSRSVTFITGKSGQMRQEFCDWLDRVPGISRIESLNGGGAYRVWFRKARQNKK